MLHLFYIRGTIWLEDDKTMAKTAHINIRIDPTVKADAEAVFASLGISLTDAINVFLYTSILEGGFPFQPKQTNKRAQNDKGG